jgi:hypothetical protein
MDRATSSNIAHAIPGSARHSRTRDNASWKSCFGLRLGCGNEQPHKTWHQRVFVLRNCSALSSFAQYPCQYATKAIEAGGSAVNRSPFFGVRISENISYHHRQSEMTGTESQSDHTKPIRISPSPLRRAAIQLLPSPMGHSDRLSMRWWWPQREERREIGAGRVCPSGRSSSSAPC